MIFGFLLPVMIFPPQDASIGAELARKLGLPEAVARCVESKVPFDYEEDLQSTG